MAKHKPVYTTEKARHLVTVYMSVTTAVALIGWLEIFIVNPLKTDAKEMVSANLKTFTRKMAPNPLTLFLSINFSTGPHGS